VRHILSSAMIAFLVGQAQAQTPSSLNAAGDEVLVRMAATGVQVYECRIAAGGEAAWAFTLITRSRSSRDPIAEEAKFERISRDLLRALFPLKQPVRLLGLTTSTLTGDVTPPPRTQLDLGL